MCIFESSPHSVLAPSVMKRHHSPVCITDTLTHVQHHASHLQTHFHHQEGFQSLVPVTSATQPARTHPPDARIPSMLILGRPVPCCTACADESVVGEIYEVELEKPIGISLARGNDGATYIARVPPGEKFDKFTPGDKVTKCSASFGPEVWEALNYGQVCFCLRRWAPRVST